MRWRRNWSAPARTSTCRAGLLRHVVDPDHQPTSEKAKAAQELIDVVQAYLK